ncbi:hypothetical protein C2E23DRAFT_882647 [Lenzites betulinus]|nr:hypothetical protein C2E23DRAFT_882647 [Lenzites betulinus]
MKTIWPMDAYYVVLQMDPVEMVKHFEDPIATAAAQAMRPKKYLFYLQYPDGLIWPNSLWARYHAEPIATTLRPEDHEAGITSDMVIPIYPNTHHPGGTCRSLRPYPSFPFPNCYHWFDNHMMVRIRRPETRFNTSRVVRLDVEELQQPNEIFNEYRARVRQYEQDKIAAGERAQHASPKNWDEEHVATLHDNASEPHSLANLDEEAAMDDVDSLPEGPEDSVPLDTPVDAVQGSQCASYDSIAAIFMMDPFGFHTDHTEEFIPLVNLWYQLTDHLTPETIPSPLDFYKERDTIIQIIHDARERSPLAELTFCDSGVGFFRNLNLNCSRGSIISEGEFCRREMAILMQKVEEKDTTSQVAAAHLPPGHATKSPTIWQMVKHKMIVHLPYPWRGRPPLLPFWP